MTRILTLLAFFLVVFSVKTASACEAGDKEMGPNCIHIVWSEPTASSEYETPMPVSTVYRLQAGVKVLVWQGNGVVEISTVKLLKVVLDVKLKDLPQKLHMEETYQWLLSAYSKR